MHIAMLSGEYPPRWGGMGSTVFHLAGELGRRGHTVTVITRRGADGAVPAQEGVEVVEVRWLKAPMAFTRSYGRHALRALEALHARRPVDVVHLHCPMISWTRGQYRRASERVAPVVATLDGSWLGERDGLRLARRQGEAAVWANPNDLAILLTAGWYARYERAALHAADLCVAISEDCRADFAGRYRPPVDWRCEVILWGVDHAAFVPLDVEDEAAMAAHGALRERYGVADEAALAGAPDTATPLLLAVGRLAARKGLRTLLRAMPAIVGAVPGARLVIVGRGHMRARLLKQAEALGVAEAVTIEPGMAFNELARMYRSADLVVYPSTYEGQGLVPLEAMASGTPAITVDHGPLPEMVDETVGGTFATGDAAALAAAVVALLQDPRRRAERGVAGRARVEAQYTYAANTDAYLGLFEQLIGQGREAAAGTSDEPPRPRCEGGAGRGKTDAE